MFFPGTQHGADHTMTSSRYLASLIPLFTTLFVSVTTYSQYEEQCSVSLQCESSWIGLGEAERAAVFEFAEDYKSFIHLARTELSFVTEAVAFAEANGFERLTATTRLTAGTRIYEVNRDRTISLLVIGEESMRNGFHVIGSHIDSPRLDLKARPLYEDSEFALFQTNYHGGLKYHQWTNLPLALMGRIDRKDGSTVAVSVGLGADDPVFMIPELSPHVDRGRNSQTLGDFIGPEDLDPVVAHIPGQDGDVVEQVLAYLDQQYAVTRADLVSAELALVPAGPPRDMGFDRGLITAYGQDDRLASYAAMRAVATVDNPQKTTMAFLVDNEEVGNRNNTGARSDHFADLLSRLLYAELGSDYREPLFRNALRNTRFISIDVNPGVNPMNPGAWELGNAPKLGYGVNLKLYGQGNNANSEFVAWTRALLDGNDIPWQTSTYKVGSAGGGTIGGEFSSQNIEVIDFGVPLLSIHTPFAVSSKVDVYNLYRAAQAFFAFQE
jgi:aspartyl aminopeptidase